VEGDDEAMPFPQKRPIPTWHAAEEEEKNMMKVRTGWRVTTRRCLFPQRPWDPSKEARVTAAASRWAAHRDAIELVEERDLSPV
jgi:hypothetical protein